jgi:hypothetical protein
MTPKEKAKDLYNRFNPHCLIKDFFGDDVEVRSTKQCALFAVNEILLNIEATILYHKESLALPINKEYWEEVKQEIEKL